MRSFLKLNWLANRRVAELRNRMAARRRKLSFELLDNRELLASFQGLGALDGNPLAGTTAAAVSANGQVVVGSSAGIAYKWKDGQITAIMNQFNSGVEYGEARDVSADGSVIVGHGERNDFLINKDGFYIDARFLNAIVDGRIQPADSIEAVSDNGNVIVGGAIDRRRSPSYPEPYRWEVSNGWVNLNAVNDFRIVAPSPTFKSLTDAAQLVSADGSVVAGVTSASTINEPFRWENSQLTLASSLGLHNVLFTTMSPDGIVVGLGDFGQGFGLFGWDKNGVKSLGTFEGQPRAASQAAQVVVGRSSGRAVIWDKERGMRQLRDVLIEQNLEGSLAGWTLTEATSITPDGLTVVGNGINPQGKERAWIAHLDAVPQPTTDIQILSATSRDGVIKYNYGVTGNPGQFVVGVYQSADTQFDPSDTLLVSQTVTPVPNTSSYNTIQLAYTPAASYPYILVVADPPSFPGNRTDTGKILETNEGNNTVVAWLVTQNELQAIMPRLSETTVKRYLDSINRAMAEFQINTSKRAAAFLSQIAVESKDLERWEEQFSLPGQEVQLRSDRPSHINKGDTEDQRKRDYFNYWYSGVNGNGDYDSDDGFNYRGRGPLQLTGYENYEKAGLALNLDLLGAPDLVAQDINVGLRTAAWYFQSHGANELADDTDTSTTSTINLAAKNITFVVNGGYRKLPERQKRFKAALAALGEI